MTAIAGNITFPVIGLEELEAEGRKLKSRVTDR